MNKELEDRLDALEKYIRIAKILAINGLNDLLPTMIEDIYFHCQILLDDYCVQRGEE